MKRKISWRILKFIPVGGDESQAITTKQKGFMHLCEQYGDGELRGYTIHDTKGMFAKYGYNNLNIDWSDFRKAFIKASMSAPPEKPSVFQGQWFPPDHAIDMRKRLLAAVCREYISPDALAADLIDWMKRGKTEEIGSFIATLVHAVGWEMVWVESKPVVSVEVPKTDDMHPSSNPAT